jgi:hypothetical protein
MQPSKDKPGPELLAITQPQPPAVKTAAASGKSVIGSPVASVAFPHHSAHDEVRLFWDEACLQRTDTCPICFLLQLDV